MNAPKCSTPKRHYKPQKIEVKYIVKRQPRCKEDDKKSTPPLIVFFPGEWVNPGMISYIGAAYTSSMDAEDRLPSALCSGEAAYEYYLDCRPATLTPEQIVQIEARLLLSWPEPDRKDVTLRRVSRVTEDDRQSMWRSR